MQEIQNWTAVRAGAAITIHGKIDGQPFRVTGIATIRPGTTEDAIQPGTGRLCPIATSKDGTLYRLA